MDSKEPFLYRFQHFGKRTVLRPLFWNSGQVSQGHHLLPLPQLNPFIPSGRGGVELELNGMELEWGLSDCNPKRRIPELPFDVYLQLISSLKKRMLIEKRIIDKKKEVTEKRRTVI